MSGALQVLNERVHHNSQIAMNEEFGRQKQVKVNKETPLQMQNVTNLFNVDTKKTACCSFVLHGVTRSSQFLACAPQLPTGLCHHHFYY